jgi:hypothetical protein
MKNRIGILGALACIGIGLLAMPAAGLERLPVPPAIPPSAPGSIIVYGDSLLTQGQTYLFDNLSTPGWNVVIRQRPGSAICHWIPTLQQDAATVPDIRIVVVAFVGSMLDPCVQNRGTQVQVYTADATTFASFWQAQGVRVVWVGPPGPPNGPGTTGTHPLVPVFDTIARSHDQGFVDTGTELETTLQAFGKVIPQSWPDFMPCLVFDYADGACGSDGLAQVHFSSTDDHLCVVDPGFNACPVYSSGIVRWGSAIVSGVKVQEQGQGAWDPDVLYPIVAFWKDGVG